MLLALFMTTACELVEIEDIADVGVGVKRLSVASDDIAPDAAFGLFNDNIFDFTVNSLGAAWYPLLQPQLKLNVELF